MPLTALEYTKVKEKSLSLLSIMSAWLRGHREGYVGILQIHFKVRKKPKYLKQELVFSTYCIMIAQYVYFKKVFFAIFRICVYCVLGQKIEG